MIRSTRSTRTALGSIAVAVALGLGSPATAAPGTHAKPSHDQVAKDSKGDKGADKASKGDKSSKSLRKALAEIAKVDARLAHAGRESRTSGLDNAATVLENIAADQSALAVLKADVEAGSDPVDAREATRTYRAQNYIRVVNDLRHAERLSQLIAELTETLVDDAAAPTSDLDVAAAAVTSAIGAALLVGATSDRAELDAVKALLKAAHEALEVVEEYLDGLEEPVEEEPTDEGADEDTVEEQPVDESVTP